jgi:hypothetical protein
MVLIDFVKLWTGAPILGHSMREIWSGVIVGLYPSKPPGAHRAEGGEADWIPRDWYPELGIEMNSQGTG